MKTFKTRFKKFSGEYITDIIEYIKEYTKNDPAVTIAVGTDSIQKRIKTTYAVTIMMYNSDIRNGAHVVFFRESCPKIRDTNERLDREAMLAYEVSEYLNEELSKFYVREDLTEYERKSYKFHLLKCAGEYQNVAGFDEYRLVNALPLTQDEKIREYKLVDLHLDFNPSAGLTGRNKSNSAYKKHAPWIRGVGYRTYVKNIAYAATSAADLLLKDK